MLTDIFITTTNRPDLLRQSLNSFKSCTDRSQYRLTVVRDGDYSESQRVLDDFKDIIDHTLVHRENLGLGPSINQALVHIDSLKRWDGRSDSSLTVYVQDDVLYSQKWLPILSQKYLQLRVPLKLGFASGIECVEHPIRQNLGGGLILKDWLRGTNLLGIHSYWMSMWPIPKIDPETGRERGRPHNGLGSGVDWHFMRVHPESVCKTGRTNLVIPGLLQHAGYQDSTWLSRELPESDSDKRKINGR